MYSSITPLRNCCSVGLCVRTFMPASAGVVQDAGVPRRPSISTRQRRHEPNGSSESVAQSLGTWMPASTAARISDVPFGTVTAKPSMVSVTGSASAPRRLTGVP